jgi:hypothetical protein
MRAKFLSLNTGIEGAKKGAWKNSIRLPFIFKLLNYSIGHRFTLIFTSHNGVALVAMVQVLS